MIKRKFNFGERGRFVCGGEFAHTHDTFSYTASIIYIWHRVLSLGILMTHSREEGGRSNLRVVVFFFFLHLFEFRTKWQ